MDDGEKKPIVGGVLMAAGVATIALLLNHPGGEAHDFAGVLKEEAANRMMDALVHGGFVVVLAIQLVCYAVLTGKLGRTAAVAGLVFFAMGTAFLAGSMVVDGLVVPALAAKYLPTPEKYDTARGLFALCGTLISILMPMGLGFQGTALASWGWAFLRSGSGRVTGAIGLVLGAGVLASLHLHMTNPMAAMRGIAALALWALMAGFAMLRTSI